MKNLLAASATLCVLFVAGPALADACSDSLQAVTKAAASANMTSQEADKVTAGIQNAATKQAAGDAAGCVSALAEAKTILKVK